jgi:hypothetical protein
MDMMILISRKAYVMCRLDTNFTLIAKKCMREY